MLLLMACLDSIKEEWSSVLKQKQSFSERSACCGVVQLINILTLGDPQGIGVFFPEGLLGAINKPTGYNTSAPGTNAFPTPAGRVATAVRWTILNISYGLFS